MRTLLLLLTMSVLLAFQVPAAELVDIVDSYQFDQATLQYHPAYEERVRHTYFGGIYYEHVPRPESWSFDILRAGRRISCMILCDERGEPQFIRGENMPMGVVRYLRSNICNKKDSFRSDLRQ